MRPWTNDIDPRTIPDAVLASERGRRNAARVQTRRKAGGRPRKPAVCRHGREFPSTVQARRCGCGREPA